MKKFYENPVVEITVFDVEDVITTSVVEQVSTVGMSDEDMATIVTAISNNAATYGSVIGETKQASAYNWQ